VIGRYRIRNALVVLLLVGTGLAGYHRYVLGIVTNLDFWLHAAMSHTLAGALAAGDWAPAWTKDFGCGQPFLRLVAGLPYYPVALAELGFSRLGGMGEGLALLAACRLFFIAAPIAGGVGMYFLAQRLFRSPTAAIVSALAYQWGWLGIVESHYAGGMTRTAALALYPWVLLAVWRARSGRPARIAAAGVATACLVLTHMACTIFFFLSMGVFLVLGAAWERRRGRAVRARVLALASATAAATLLAAYFVVPFVAEIGWAEKGGQAQERWEPGGVLRLADFANRWKVHDPEGSAIAGDLRFSYMGLSVIALALAAVAGARRRRFTLPAAATALLAALVVARVVPNPFAFTAYRPFGSHRYLHVLCFYLCLLAGPGADAVWGWLSPKRLRPGVRTGLVAAVLFVDFIWLAAGLFPPGRVGRQAGDPPLTYGSNSTWPLGPAWTFLRDREEPGRVVNFRMAAANAVGPVWHGKPNAQYLYRQMSADALRDFVDGVRAELLRYLRDEKETPPAAFLHRLAMLDVRWVVWRYHSSAFYPPPPPRPRPPLARRRGWVEAVYVVPDETCVLYRVARADPVVLPARVARVPGEKPWETFWKTISHDPAFDPWKISFLYEAPPPGAACVPYPEGKEALARAFDAAPRGTGRAKVAAWENTRIEIDVERPDAGWAVVASQHYPNWHATAGGRPAPVARAQAGLTAVFVPAGRHRVTLVFRRPWYDTAGALVSGAALLAALAAFAHGAVARRRRAAARGAP
jgi:hypothetical protein